MCELCKVSECIPGKAICAECRATLKVLDLELFVHFAGVLDKMVERYDSVLRRLED